MSGSQRTPVVVGGARGFSVRRPTLDDVARAARVAPTTVSAVLNERPHCYASAATRKRVFESAERLGYRPNLMARGLLGQSTQTIGLVLANLRTEMTSRKIDAVEAAARAASFVTITSCNDGRDELEDRCLEWLLDRSVDGIVVCPSGPGRHEGLRRLSEQSFPLVTLGGQGVLTFPTWDVSGDILASGRMQVEHLLAQGRRRIGLVGLTPLSSVNGRKLEGMKGALSDAGLAPVDLLWIDRPAGVTASSLAVRQHLKRWLADHPELDAIALVGDLLALNGMAAAVELGRRIPEDLAVIGHDGIEAGRVGAVPLSTVMHDPEEAGRRAFELLHRLIRHELTGPPTRQVLRPRLIVRASTASTPQKGAAVTQESS